MPLSASFDHFRDGQDFRIPKADPAFEQTGLTEECFVIDESAFYPVPDLTHSSGRLTGDLLDRFKRWIGDP